MILLSSWPRGGYQKDLFQSVLRSVSFSPTRAECWRPPRARKTPSIQDSLDSPSANSPGIGVFYVPIGWQVGRHNPTRRGYRGLQKKGGRTQITAFASLGDKMPLLFRKLYRQFSVLLFLKLHRLNG